MRDLHERTTTFKVATSNCSQHVGWYMTINISNNEAIEHITVVIFQRVWGMDA